MKFNTSFAIDQIADYLAIPDSKRPFARYREDLLDPEPAFTADETGRLIEIVRMAEPQYSKFSVSKLLIDLSWASSHLEGNTYTQLDTQVLIEYGKRNVDKPVEDAAMILNHKAAIELLISEPVLSENSIRAIHRCLADNHLAPESRHFLEPGKCGVVRSYTPHGLHIDGSSYMPPQAEDRVPGFIEEEFKRIIRSANELRDPVNQSFFLLTRIPYLQVFYDANKRTSRISCNIPLLRDGLSPLSFVDFEKDKYLGGLMAFYELGDERLLKNEFMTAYLASAFRYLPFSEESKFALSVERDKHLAEARRYVVEGVRDEKPVWLAGFHDSADPDMDNPSGP